MPAYLKELNVKFIIPLLLLEAVTNIAISQNISESDSTASRLEKWISKLDFKIGLRTPDDLNLIEDKLEKDLMFNYYYGDPVYESGNVLSILFDPEILGGRAKVNSGSSGFEGGIDYNISKRWKVGMLFNNTSRMTSFGAAGEDGHYVDSYIRHNIDRKQFSLSATYQLARAEKKERKVFSLNGTAGIYYRLVNFKTSLELRNPNPVSNPVPGFNEVSKEFEQKINLLGKFVSIGIDVRLLKHFSFYINENFSFDSGFSVDRVELSNGVITRKFSSSDLSYGIATTSLGISYNW